MTLSTYASVSVYALLQQLPVIGCSYATWVQLIHLLEDMLLEEGTPAVLAVGFHETAYWQQEAQRYHKLAQIAQPLFLFSNEPLPESFEVGSYVAVSAGTPLRNEWFFLLLCERLPVLLCGHMQHDSPDAFSVTWTFEPAVVNQAFDVLEPLIDRHCKPDRLALQAERAKLPPPKPDIDLIARVTLDLVRIEQRANRDLHEQHQMMDAILNALNFHVYVSRFTPDQQLVGVYRSGNLEKITGYQSEHLRSEERFWYKRIHPEDRERADLYWRRLQRGEGGTVSYRLRHADGHIIWVQHHTRVHTDPATGDRLVYGIFYDITDDVKLRAEKQMSAMKSTFMSRVSHEFRTPLATILSSTELLMRYDDRMTSQSRHDKLENIQRQVEHMTQMLDNMATVIRADHLRLKPVAQEPASFFRLVLDKFLEANQPAQSIRCTLDCEYTHIRIDPNLLTPVIMQLLSNAAKFSPPDTEILYDVRVDADWLMIEITDYGIGILAEDQPHIFEPLFRGSNVGNIAGTGIGLKIAADYVALQGGNMTFESMDGNGTTFTVRLPLDV